ncbi:P-loop NTPase fold protein [Amycolatopsis sp. cg5]|uniref:KAP family P-loop NTPase fold protein n=1 Tax=Amycolatopsis sp. cg5 TaxID=3238802 RepID=UPI0035246A26
MAVTGDNPIRDTPQDALGRAPLAKHLADELRQVDATEGSVVAVMGPWGYGKTSLINLIRRHLETEPPLTVLDFNPWMFSGTEQLVDSFFTELAAQLDIKEGKFSKIATELSAYGELLSPLGAIPVLGSWITRLGASTKALKQFHERKKESVTQKRAKLAGILANLEQPLIVVIDDIDRLDTNEIRHIFKLVRLTASFPNVVYLLAFDRERVEQALSETGLSGRNYLEKIVQVSVDIPAIPVTLLRAELGRTLDSIINGIHLSEPRFDEQRWLDVFAEIIDPLLRNMRDVRRFAASLQGTLRSLRGEVEIVDVLAMEAVRVFVPDLYRAAIENKVALTEPSSSFIGRREDSEHKDAIDNLIATSAEHSAVAKALVHRVFPAADRHIDNGMHYDASWQRMWIREHRLAHPALLSFYFERLTNKDLDSFNHATNALSVMNNAEAFEEFFKLLDPHEREDVIVALENFEGEYPVEAVVPGSIGLLNTLPSLPERERGMLSMGDGRLHVTRVVLRLFRRLDDEAKVEAASREVLPQISTLSSKLEFVHMIGHVEGTGHRLVSEVAARELESMLSAEIQRADGAQLKTEPNLLGLMIWMRNHTEEESTFMTNLFGDPEFNCALLLQSVCQVRSQSVGSRVIQREARLYWETLETIYGDQETLRDGVQSVRHHIDSVDQEVADATELAMKYLTGWRPERF